MGGFETNGEDPLPPAQRPEPRFDWFIPIDGDGSRIGTLRPERPPSFDYLRSVVDAAERHGYYSLLIPTRFANGLFEESAPLAETWTMVTALAAVSSRVRFLVAVRPGFVSTGLFAQMAATLDQISGGRLDINVVPGESRATSSAWESRAATTAATSGRLSSSARAADCGRRRSRSSTRAGT